MKFITKALVAGFILSAGVVFAGKSTDPDAMARQALMGTIGANTGILGDMAGGKTAFDAAKAEAAKAALAEAAGKIAATFEPQGTDAESKSKPEIWTGWDAFIAEATALGAAASALDATTIEGVQAGMAGVGGACQSCHKLFRL